MNVKEPLVGPRAPGVLEQAVDDDLIVFNPANEGYFTLNRSAREVWELADGTDTASGIAATLAQRYGVDAGELHADVAEIIASFREAGLV